MTEQINIGAKHILETGTNAKGFPTAKVYTETAKGRKTRYNFWFRTEAARDEWALKTANEMLNEERQKAARKAEAKAAAKSHTVKSGDVFCHSWGYEQTNIDFYEVVKVSGQMLELRQTMQETIEHLQCGGVVVPRKGEYYGDKSLKKRINFHKGTPYISMPYGWCPIWEGRPESFTNYA
jgi:hypothetical protein